MNTNMEAIVWAMHARGLEPVTWKILVKLAARVNSERRDFDVWPSNRQIAEDAETSVATVKRHLPILVDEGFIRILPQTRKDGATSSNRIRLLVRSKHVMPKGVEIDVDAESMDHDLSWGGVQSEPGPRVTGEPCREPLESGTYSSEPLPPSPDGEGPPVGDSDLFGGELPVVEPPKLEDVVMELWTQLKLDEPGIAGVDVLSEAMKRKITARAGEVVRGRSKKAAGTVPPEGLTPEGVWREIFDRIRRSTFLCGRAPPGKGRTGPFKLTIDYVLRQDQFLKILVGGYDDDERFDDRRDFDAGSGRSYGPGEATVRRALSRLHDAGERGDRSGGDRGSADRRGSGSPPRRAGRLPR